MYAVIFRAEIKQFDDSYSQMANRMREIAINEYGCIDFISYTEGEHEVAISYWSDKQAIQDWKNNPEHKKAQALGNSRWYKSYQVDIVEVLHSYPSQT